MKQTLRNDTRREAQPLRPFWSKAVRNLTKLSEVLGRDPNTGAVLRRAQTIEDAWLASELASAKEAEQTARAAYDRAVSAARAELTDEALAAAWAEGHELPVDGAVEEALARDEAAVSGKLWP